MRVRAMALVAIFVTTGSAFAATAHAVDADTFYLKNDGIPFASLEERPPKAGELANFDPGRDITPGLLLERTPNGPAETDEAKFQHWQTETGALTVSGIPTLVLWASLNDFDPTKIGVFTAYLLDCPSWGYDCTTLVATEHAFQLRPTDTWVETMITFPEVEYEIPEDRALGIKIVVSSKSEDDLLFAYDRLSYRSRLVFTSEPLVAAATGEAQDVAPAMFEDPAPALTGPVGEVPVADVAEVVVALPEDQSMSPAWEWFISLTVSGLMLGTLSLFLLENLFRRGNHVVANRRWGWLTSIRAR